MEGGVLRYSRELAIRALHAHIYGRTPIEAAFHTVVELELAPEPEDAGNPNRIPPTREAVERAARLVELALEHWHEAVDLLKTTRALQLLAAENAPIFALPALVVHIVDGRHLAERAHLNALGESLFRIMRKMAGRNAAQITAFALDRALGSPPPKTSA